jgi:hypothetical protein
VPFWKKEGYGICERKERGGLSCLELVMKGKWEEKSG